MLLPPPRYTRPDHLLPYTTLFRSRSGAAAERLAAHGGPRAALASQKTGAQRCERFGFAHHLPSPYWPAMRRPKPRSEEHTSELQSLMRISYAVFCLKKQNITTYKKEQIDQDRKHDTQHTQME